MPVVVTTIILYALLARGVRAGPENLLLVVNPKSTDSMTVANYYQAVRQIPAGNVHYVPWEPGNQRTDIDTFRREILMPVLRAAFRPGRQGGRIDYIVYSVDFPWGINLKPDLQRFRQAAEEGEEKQNLPKQITSVGSITGLTYLWQAVAAKSRGYLSLRSNWYMQPIPTGEEKIATRPFSSDTPWGPAGKPLGEDAEKPGRRYVLSVMLGVTAEHGNTVEEIVGYLRRSAGADGRMPDGTIYLMRNSNIRSKIRHGSYRAAAVRLERLGVNAEIIEDKLPRQRPDVQGLMTGTARFTWTKSGSRIRPGAVCEHLTSYGGVLDKPGQTKLSAFLRHGAAGSSGTVTEPYAIAQKFPAPTLHLHYARGRTLAEAYYQSVAGPYQLLIVGDPLCRPWGREAHIAVDGLPADEELSGEYRIEPSIRSPGGESPDYFESYIDGKYLGRFAPGTPIPLDTTPLADGHHRLRLTAAGRGIRPVQGRRVIEVVTRNHRRRIAVRERLGKYVAADRPLPLRVRAPGSIGVAVLHNERLIERLTGASGTVEIDPTKLGLGPVSLKVIGLGQAGPASHVIAPPVEIVLQPTR